MLGQQLFVLLKHGQKVHVDITSCTVSQHFLHGLQHATGVLAIHVHIAQVALQHVNNVEGVVIVVLTDDDLSIALYRRLVTEVLLEVFQQVVG